MKNVSEDKEEKSIKNDRQIHVVTIIVNTSS